jgi:hypothetical protein
LTANTSSQHFVFFPIQIDRDEVVLRRQIGLKKDEYSLDKKHVRYRIGDLLFPPSSLLTPSHSFRCGVVASTASKTS